jgi:hypothetical protein
MERFFDLLAVALTRRGLLSAVALVLGGKLLGAFSTLSVDASGCPVGQCLNTVTGACVSSCPNNGCCQDGSCVAKCAAGSCCEAEVCIPKAACAFCCNTVLGQCVAKCASTQCCFRDDTHNDCYAACPAGLYCDDTRGHGVCVSA